MIDTTATLVPKFKEFQLIEIISYAGTKRSEIGEVYKVSWSVEGCWLYHVRCFTADGERPKFRNFLDCQLEAM